MRTQVPCIQFSMLQIRIVQPSQEKVEKIRKGVKVNGRVIKFWVDTIRQKHTNSWIHLKSNDNSISDIRNVFERLSLRINRIIRTEYGPFRIGKVKNPGDVVETHIPSSVNSYMYYRYKEKLQNSVRKLDDTKLEVIKNNMIIDQKHKIEENKKATKISDYKNKFIEQKRHEARYEVAFEEYFDKFA